MLNVGFRNLLEERLSYESKRQIAQLGMDIDACKADRASRGMLMSPETVDLTTQMCCRTTLDNGHLISGIITEQMISAEIKTEDGLEKELKNIAGDQLMANARFILRCFRQKLKNFSCDYVTPGHIKALNDAHVQVLSDVYRRIEVLLSGTEKPIEEFEEMKPTGSAGKIRPTESIDKTPEIRSSGPFRRIINWLGKRISGM